MNSSSILRGGPVRGFKVFSIGLPLWLVCTASARADITPISSSISSSALADIDPDDPNVPDLHQDSTSSQLRPMSVSSFDTDVQPVDLSENVASSASVSYIGNDTIIVHMSGARSGTDSAPGAPGGEYASIDAYRMRFQNLTANSSLLVSWVLHIYNRPYEMVTTPIGFGVRDAIQIFHGDSIKVPFDSHSGTNLQGSQTLDLTSTGALGVYTLELDLFMSGRTTDLAPPESWDATLTITTPPMTITPIPEPAGVAGLISCLLAWWPRRCRNASAAGSEPSQPATNLVSPYPSPCLRGPSRRLRLLRPASC
ncbi:MAG TPA: hypothetical protein VH518_22820 [Tepidisphaeraceae bacterium]